MPSSSQDRIIIVDEFTPKLPGRRVRRQCDHCGQWMEVQANRVERGSGQFCSRECYGRSMRNEVVVTYRGQDYRVNSQGYAVSMGDVRDATYLHRDVWENCRGPIPDGMVIHHVDENRLNNGIGNLQMMTHGDHTRHHTKTGVTYAEFNCAGCGKMGRILPSELERSKRLKRSKHHYCSLNCARKFAELINSGKRPVARPIFGPLEAVA